VGGGGGGASDITSSPKLAQYLAILTNVLSGSNTFDQSSLVIDNLFKYFLISACTKLAPKRKEQQGTHTHAAGATNQHQGLSYRQHMTPARNCSTIFFRIDGPAPKQWTQT